jgi:hypothetical protein
MRTGQNARGDEDRDENRWSPENGFLPSIPGIPDPESSGE